MEEAERMRLHGSMAVEDISRHLELRRGVLFDRGASE